MSRHTPGPWRIELTTSQSVHGTYCVAFVVNDNTNVADVCASANISEEEAHANARLIASAPQLLEALRELLAASGHDETLQGGERIGKRDDARLSAGRLNGAIVAAKAALSSTGTQP